MAREYVNKNPEQVSFNLDLRIKDNTQQGIVNGDMATWDGSKGVQNAISENNITQGA